MKIDFQDRIDDYLLGKMSDEDVKIFEHDIEQNAELREQVEFTKSVQTAIISRGEKLKKIQEWEDDYKWTNDRYVSCQTRPTGSGYEPGPNPSENKTFSQPHSSRKGYLYWISGIAALFVVGFFLFEYIYFVGDEDVAFSPRPQGASTIRGIDVTTENLLAKADYRGALERIESLDDEIATELMTLERDKVVRGAEGEDEIAYKQEELKLKQEKLSWLKVHALLGLNRKEEAIALLDKIRHSESEYKEQADSLYNLYK